MAHYNKRVLIYIPNARVDAANEFINGGPDGPQNFNAIVERISDGVQVGRVANWQMTQEELQYFGDNIDTAAARTAGVRWIVLSHWDPRIAERIEDELASRGLRFSTQ